MDKQRDFEKGWEEYKAKNKQNTEELIGIIQGAVGGCARNWASLIAEEVLKYYQPKIPENEVVLTEKELFERDEKIHKSANEYIKVLEKFAEMVSQAIVDNTYPYFDKDGKPVNIWKATTGFDKLDEIVKEFTGGKNEN